MPHHICREKYRLDLKWERIEYSTNQVAQLIGAAFSGPVLKDALQIEAPDFIDLDLTPQLLTVLDSYYIIRLSWEGVEYRPDGTVYLLRATLTNNVLKEFHKLQDSDYITINTEKHEEATHAYNLVYESTVIRSDNEPYNYKEE